MFYWLIVNPDTDVQGYAEVYASSVVRTTDMDGNDLAFPAYSLVDANPAQPSWALPDPTPTAPETPPEPVPPVITKRQFLIQLLRSGMVTEAEVPTLAIAPPASITTIFAGLASEASLEIALTWAAMTEVERHNGLIDMAVGAGLMTEADLDDFFRAAALI